MEFKRRAKSFKSGPLKIVSSVIESSFENVVGLPSFLFAPVSKFICELRLGADLDEVVPAKVIEKISPRARPKRFRLFSEWD